MDDTRAGARHALIEALSKSLKMRTLWSYEELIEMEASWGSVENPKKEIDDLISQGELVEVGLDYAGRKTYTIIMGLKGSPS